MSELRSIVAGQVINEWEGDEGVVLILFLGVLFVISMFGIINIHDSPFDNPMWVAILYKNVYELVCPPGHASSIGSIE